MKINNFYLKAQIPDSVVCAVLKIHKTWRVVVFSRLRLMNKRHIIYKADSSSESAEKWIFDFKLLSFGWYLLLTKFFAALFE
jgi:hypothetical protein